MEQKSDFQELVKGIFRKNPVFCLVLGLCPFLAVSTSLNNSIGMGVAATFVLILSSTIISFIRNIIPKRVRIPVFIVIIASFVTIVSLVMQAYFPSLNEALGIYVPLIVSNCIIMGRVEAFASRNRPFKSILDAAGMGIGFTFSLLLIGGIREILGTGSLEIFNMTLFTIPMEPAMIFILPPGALLTMGLLMGLFKHISNKKEATE
ncbi:MAG: electron transport complex subunit RsxE [Nanobdellota archaeon]